MKKYLLASVFSIIAATSAMADNYFHREVAGQWQIFGSYGDARLNPSCSADFNYNDGSQFRLIKDIHDGELYIYFLNTDWNIRDEAGLQYTVRLNFLGSRGTVTGGTIPYTLLGKNAIHIRNISGERFIPDFAAMSKLQFVMPGTIQNTTITLNGSNQAVDALVRCFSNAKTQGVKKILAGTPL
jgi:hypothetical protein